MADSSTVCDEDLVPIPLIDPDRNGEVLGVRYNEGQRFYYKSGLTPEEVVLIKCFDSECGLGVPHSAFVDADTESIEEARERYRGECFGVPCRVRDTWADGGMFGGGCSGLECISFLNRL